MLRKRKKGKNSPVYMNERTQWEALPVTPLQNEKRFVQAGEGRVVPVSPAAARARGTHTAGPKPPESAASPPPGELFQRAGVPTTPFALMEKQGD